jgi:riboflavin synthase
VFTGIIESFGTIKAIESNGEGKILHIGCDLDLTRSKIGDSIAVNGACLTAVALGKFDFKVDMAPETVARTAFKRMGPGTRVNIERALRLSDRIDGHLVSGHIDGTGTISSVTRNANALIMSVAVDEGLAADMIEKGSVAIDGISLTINQVSQAGSKTWFQVSVIPHTADVTTIGLKKVGDEVNIETDMLGKYVRKILTGRGGKNDADSQKKSDISMATLAKNGFL